MNYKKIILLLILLFPTSVFASDYIRVFEPCVESDICKIEEIKKYNTYSLNRIDMGYLSDNNEYIKDSNDYIVSYGDEVINIHTYQPSVSKIIFTYVPPELKIYEIEVYYNNVKIDYTPRISNSLELLKRFYDNDFDTYYSHDNYQKALVLILDKEYDTKDLVIKMYTKKQDNYTISLDMKDAIILNNDRDRWHIIKIDSHIIEPTFYSINEEKKYRYYKEEKIINNIYEPDGDNLILDDYITEYIYYKKEDDTNKTEEKNTVYKENKLSNLKEDNNNKSITLNEEKTEKIDEDKEYLISDNNKKNNKHYIRYVFSIFLIIFDIILVIKRKKKNVESI